MGWREDHDRILAFWTLERVAAARATSSASPPGGLVLGREYDGTLTISEVNAPSFMKLAGLRADGSHSSLTDRPGSAGILAEIADRLFIERAIERNLDHSVKNFKALVEARQSALV